MFWREKRWWGSLATKREGPNHKLLSSRYPNHLTAYLIFILDIYSSVLSGINSDILSDKYHDIYWDHMFCHLFWHSRSGESWWVRKPWSAGKEDEEGMMVGWWINVRNMLTSPSVGIRAWTYGDLKYQFWFCVSCIIWTCPWYNDCLKARRWFSILYTLHYLLWKNMKQICIVSIFQVDVAIHRLGWNQLSI